MRGYAVPRQAGWDTHGLPVEVEVEKQLGITDKRQIEEQVGIGRVHPPVPGVGAQLRGRVEDPHRADRLLDRHRRRLLDLLTRVRGVGVVEPEEPLGPGAALRGHQGGARTARGAAPPCPATSWASPMSTGRSRTSRPTCASRSPTRARPPASCAPPSDGTPSPGSRWWPGPPRRGPCCPTPVPPSAPTSSTPSWTPGRTARAATSWPPIWWRRCSARMRRSGTDSRVRRWWGSTTTGRSTTWSRPRAPPARAAGGWWPASSSRPTRGRASSTWPRPSARSTGRWDARTTCPPSTRSVPTGGSPRRWPGWRASRCGTPTAPSTTAWRPRDGWSAVTPISIPTPTAGAAAPPSSTGASPAGTSGPRSARPSWWPRTRPSAGTPSTSGTAAWGSGWPTTSTGRCPGTGSGGHRSPSGGAGRDTSGAWARWPNCRSWPAGTSPASTPTARPSTR